MSINPQFKNPVYVLQELIKRPSVTPNEAGVLDLVQEITENLGFTTQRIEFQDPDSYDVENLYGSIGTGKPHLVCTGHLDVVPTDHEELWKYPPFSATIADGQLYGRGAVDMKGGVACMLAAIARYVEKKPEFGKISIALTCDEEGLSINGFRKLTKWAQETQQNWDAAINAEPTNPDKVGTTIKVGRRGSLSGNLTVFGTAGHVAYPHLSQNPVPILLELTQKLLNSPLDNGTANFAPSNLEITSIDVGNTARNVIPAQATAQFNIRFNDSWSSDTLKAEIQNRLNTNNDYRYELEWVPYPAEAFSTSNPQLFELMAESIKDVTNITAKASTDGGSSDARFIKDYCPVVEFGLVGATMHQVDERVDLTDLETLTCIFEKFLEKYFKQNT